ncbi:Cyanovirin-N [Aspergillus aurantiobrunneus]
MYRYYIPFTLASAALTAAQGYSSECTNVSLNNAWLIATCPTGKGDDITSSVFLNYKIGNNDGVLEWSENGQYRQSCSNCILSDSATLQCECRTAAIPRNRNTTLNLEEHIANYEGHLLSNQTGPITTIPENSATPVPTDLAVQIGLASNGDICERPGVTLGLNMPTDCYYLNLGPVIPWTAGITSRNEGWEIVAFSDSACTSEPVYTFTIDDNDQCVVFEPDALAFSVKPLWNADY